ncbi:hypothetical protein BIY40_07095 [Pediococcus acidilactici]|nr:hypothetical protein BIY40_07095 [Pediococcus acidilactici]
MRKVGLVTLDFIASKKMGPIDKIRLVPIFFNDLDLRPCCFAETRSSHQFFPVNQILGLIAQTAIKPKIQLILHSIAALSKRAPKPSSFRLTKLWE